MKILVLTLFLIFASCKSNQTKDETNQKIDCSKYNDKYVEFAMNNKKDSAFYYIDKAILCDPKDEFFKSEKMKLLIQYKDYENAVKLAKVMSNEGEPTYVMLYGILLMKQGDSESVKVLKKANSLLSKIVNDYSEENLNLHFYRIGLDNYFQGKNYSLKMVQKFRDSYVKEHEIQLANYIEDLINNESKENVLFNLFTIDND